MAEPDTSIILNAGNLQGPNPNTLVSMFSLAQQVQAAKQETVKKNALLSTFADPNSVDPATGSPTPQAIRKVMAVDPEMGLKLQDDALSAQVQRAQIAHYKTDAGKANFDFMASTAGVGYDAYDAAKLAGKPEAEAIAAGQAARNEAVKNNGGAIGDDIADGILAKPFDPAGARALAGANKEWLAGQSEKVRAKAEADKAAADQKRLEQQGKHDAALEAATANKGWSDPYTTKDGRTISINKNTGETREIKGVEGLQKVGGAGAGGTFTPQMGELMAATAEKGVSLPTGFRSKAQQIQLYQGLLDRNPGKTPDEIATMLKTGQIEFGAQKKETQTAAGIAGKVEVAANELNRFVPLVRAASADFKRGNFKSLNSLIQTADSQISDPKLKTLKGYIVGTLNAYDVLAARGGTDKEKRAENREQLLSADGDQAINAALDVILKESEIAHQSSVEATRVPELDSPKPDAAKPKVSNAADYNALPSGSHFIDPKGVERVKP